MAARLKNCSEDPGVLSEEGLSFGKPRSYPNRVGETYAMTFDLEHRWYCVPEMRTIEALLLKCLAPSRWACPVRAAHAFIDPTTPADATAREYRTQGGLDWRASASAAGYGGIRGRPEAIQLLGEQLHGFSTSPVSRVGCQSTADVSQSLPVLTHSLPSVTPADCDPEFSFAPSIRELVSLWCRRSCAPRKVSLAEIRCNEVRIRSVLALLGD